MELKITNYNEEYERQWDDFVENKSINGTFLQSRKFLNYHAKGRFEDCSIMFWDVNRLMCVCPACILVEEGKKVFYSHKGSTYGGLVISAELMRVNKMRELLETFETYLKEQHFHKCVLKPTMDILCSCPQKILEFYMFFYQYREWKELNFYIDYEKYDTSDIISNFSKMKKRNTKKCITTGFELKQLTKQSQIDDFHKIITATLLKYNRIPVHNVDELCEIKKRLGTSVEFYGVYLDDKILAGTMVFLFEKAKCAHTQYLAADPEYKHLNAMTFVYFKMVEMFAKRKYRYLSWGIATEHMGSEINYSLANNKEEFGSIHSINYVYEKILSD